MLISCLQVGLRPAAGFRWTCGSAAAAALFFVYTRGRSPRNAMTITYEYARTYVYATYVYRAVVHVHTHADDLMP